MHHHNAPSPLPPSPRKGDTVLKVQHTFEAHAKPKPLLNPAGCPEAVPYIRPLKGLCV